MIKPSSLKVGDTIAMVGLSSPTNISKIKKAVESFENLGLIVKVSQSCYMQHGYLTANDEIKANEINSYFKNKDVKAIFNMRGGYGAQRILDKLDYKAIKENPKIFAGYSDTTALHIAINQKCDLITYHSPMPISEDFDNFDNYTRASFINNFFSDKPVGSVQNPTNEKLYTLIGGHCRGIITGGNLSLLASSLGTDYELDTKNKVLFIEEIGEEPYKIDRMLLQLKYANKFSDCVGIIFGAFSNCNPTNNKASLSFLDILNELIAPENKPTVYNFRCGHCLPTSTIALGNIVELNSSKGDVCFL